MVNMKKGKEPGPKGYSEGEGKRMGQGDFANMPQSVMMKPYPKDKSGDKHLDDTITRLDDDERNASGKMKKDMSNGMY